jgi:hypothetical protein
MAGAGSQASLGNEIIALCVSACGIQTIN